MKLDRLAKLKDFCGLSRKGRLIPDQWTEALESGFFRVKVASARPTPPSGLPHLPAPSPSIQEISTFQNLKNRIFHSGKKGLGV